MLLAMLIMACHGQPPADVQGSPPGEPSPGTTPHPPPGGVVEGVATWSSAACGDRSYERVITLLPDFTFSAEDRVSPCPEGAQCIWSGVVPWSGTWTPSPEPRGVYLNEAEVRDGDKGQPRPKLLVYAADGRLMEDGTGCAYDRVADSGLTAPQK